MKFRLNCKLEGVKYDIVVSRILDCIAYWNKEGDWVFKSNHGWFVSNREGEAQDPASEWLMDRIYSDCEYVMSYAHELAECSKGTYEFGRGGSHIWLHKNGDRIAIITCPEEEYQTIK
jgi:hypothetical protein